MKKINKKSCYLKVDVVLGDMTTSDKELKTVTMEEVKWSEGLYIRYRTDESYTQNLI